MFLTALKAGNSALSECSFTAIFKWMTNLLFPYSIVVPGAVGMAERSCETLGNSCGGTRSCCQTLLSSSLLQGVSRVLPQSGFVFPKRQKIVWQRSQKPIRQMGGAFLNKKKEFLSMVLLVSLRWGFSFPYFFSDLTPFPNWGFNIRVKPVKYQPLPLDNYPTAGPLGGKSC